MPSLQHVTRNLLVPVQRIWYPILSFIVTGPSQPKGSNILQISDKNLLLVTVLLASKLGNVYLKASDSVFHLIPSALIINSFDLSSWDLVSCSSVGISCKNSAIGTPLSKLKAPCGGYLSNIIIFLFSFCHRPSAPKMIIHIGFFL